MGTPILPKNFDYQTWLNELKNGEELYINGKKGIFIGRTETELVAGIEGSHTVKYFSPKNGRELGGRLGQYRDSFLFPYTKEQREKEKLAEDKKKFKEKKENLIKSIMDLLVGYKITGYYSCIENKIANRPYAYLVSLEKALEKVNDEKDWSQTFDPLESE